MKRSTVGSIGTIISGTLNPTDLFSAYLWEAGHLTLTREERNAVRKIAARRIPEDDSNLEGELDADLDELAAILEVHAPCGCYFGSTEGDGAEIGWWPDWDSIREDALQVADLADIPKGHTGVVMVTNDHGNVTLYDYSRGRGRALWAIV